MQGSLLGVRAWALPALALLALGLLGAPAYAQDAPYGSTTTEAPPQATEVTCSLDISSGQAGTAGVASVSGVPTGSTVRLIFGGTQVGSAEATGSGDATTVVRIPFSVPSVSPGQYLVAAAGPSFTAECNAEFAVGEVAGATTDRPGQGDSVLGSDVSRSGRSTRGGSLPRTGMYVAALVLIGLIMVIAGRTALAGARRRRRRLSRPTDLAAASPRHRA